MTTVFDSPAPRSPQAPPGAARPWVTHYAFPSPGDTTAVVDALNRLRDVVDDAASWHYLHYANAAGFHLRVRTLATDAAARTGLALAVRSALEPVCDAVLAANYFPESRKYGTGDSLAASEELFCASSRFARELLGEDIRVRVITSANLMYAVLRAFPQIDAVSFTYHYAWYWNGGPSARRAGSVRLAGGGRESVDRISVFVDTSTELFARVSMSPYSYVFHHLHLTNNRLGLSRQMEVMVAQIVSAAMEKTDV